MSRRPNAIQSILGHGSAAFTLTVYGHVFDEDLGSLGERLEAVHAAPFTGQRRDEGRTGESRTDLRAL